MFKAIECPSCFRQLAAPQIDIFDLEAECKDCTLNFSFQDQLPIEIRQKYELNSPDGIDIVRTEEVFEMDLKWLEVYWRTMDGKINYSMFIALGLIAPFVWLWGWLVTSEANSEVLLFALRSILFVIWGFLFIYLPMASFLNSSKLVIRNEKLIITHGPWPSLNFKKVIPTKQIKQIYITKGSGFDLKIKTSATGSRDLLSGISTAQAAIFIEQEIEKFLEIEDEQVAGEWQG